MHDLGTIRYINAYAATVEQLKADGDEFRSKIANTTWPSDAPAVPRSMLRANLPTEYLHDKRFLRRKALFIAAIRKERGF